LFSRIENKRTIKELITPNFRGRRYHHTEQTHPRQDMAAAGIVLEPVGRNTAPAAIVAILIEVNSSSNTPGQRRLNS